MRKKERERCALQIWALCKDNGGKIRCILYMFVLVYFFTEKNCKIIGPFHDKSIVIVSLVLNLLKNYSPSKFAIFAHFCKNRRYK